MSWCIFRDVGLVVGEWRERVNRLVEDGKGREGKGREGKGREGKGREGKGREGKGRENGAVHAI